MYLAGQVLDRARGPSPGLSSSEDAESFFKYSLKLLVLVWMRLKLRVSIRYLVIKLSVINIWASIV